MADYELIGLNEAGPDLRAPTSADRGKIVGGVLVGGLAELDGGADILGDPVATLSRTNPLARAIAVQMTASTTVGGIQQISNNQLNLGVNDFTFRLKVLIPTTRPSANQTLCQLIGGSGYRIILLTSGVLSTDLLSSNYATSAVASATQFSLDLTQVIVRETASTAGSVTTYINGVIFGSPFVIAPGSPSTLGPADFRIMGTGAARLACNLYESSLFNRALTAAEVLDLSINGVALADRGASQTPIATFDFSAGVDGFTGFNGTAAGNIDGIGGVDNTLRLTATSADNVRATKALTTFTGRTAQKFRAYMPAGNVTAKGVQVRQASAATSTVIASVVLTPDTWTEISIPNTTPLADQTGLAIYMMTAAGLATGITSGDLMYIESGGTITRLGLTSELLASNAQSNTGQIFDSSGNKNHALLPASGATVVGRPVSQTREVRWTNTWSGTNELQYIGGVNQAIIPANAYIESIIGTVSGATPHDIIVGDGSDTDRYVTITTGLAAGTTSFTLANRTTDGTNLKLTVDPDTNATMSIAWVIRFSTLEA